MAELLEFGVQAAIGVIAMTFGIISGAVSAVSAVGWLGDLPWLATTDTGEVGPMGAAMSLVMIAGFGSASVLSLRAARRMLK
ncbi:MAG TPA: hypothetical protein VG407_11835 [Caulobacteraceae bacterium]|nr:hypothetical protein [Caulobacteraceae bacterium]